MVNLPSPFSDIPRVKLLFDRPADTEPLSRLTESLDCGARVWILREDCNSGLAFGGSQVRKLEYVLADALAQRADTLVTTGGIQSNHMCQTSAATARLGLQVALYPKDAVASSYAEHKNAGNVQAKGIFGAETFPIGTKEETGIKTLKERGRTPYSIPKGASTYPLGGLGFARWLGVTFDVIISATGSCSTLGGMVASFKLAQKLEYPNSKKRLLGFSILNPLEQEVVDLVLTIAKTAASKIGLSPDDFTEDDFEIDAWYLGGAYGNLDERTSDGIKELARLEGEYSHCSGLYWKGIDWVFAHC
ncbi:hypothetical protein LCI18_015180 [Fusarium solani-melongenae]|uniref:Uncharacterized protein n=1 Tax=Fusarium solani subsp. cucurbitae TaxID=2747967 RepID=A0ACD3ZT11_FUSSC|nr:hypothetical protein LCI18_015180 [Fusarium solani-melongenae]